MTTIAWDGRVLAADSQSTAGDMICSLNERKIYQPADGQLWQVNGEEVSAFGSSGDCGAEEAIIDTMISGMSYKSELPEIMEFSAIAISKTGKAFLIFKSIDKKNLSISLHDGEYAVGSGAIIARTAMNLGHNAVSAVKAAINLDVYSGGEVMMVSLLNEKESIAKCRA